MRTLLGDKFSNYRIELFKFAVILLLPCVIFFRRDFDYYLHPERYLIYGILYSLLVLITIILFLMGFSKARRFMRKKDFVWTAFSGAVLVSSILFGTEISVLKEVWTFRVHQDDFSKLVTIAENLPPETEIEDTHVEIPDNYKGWSGQNHITVFRGSSNSLQLVALISRPSTYFTYLPDHRHIPDETLHFRYGYGVNCYYELTEYWYLCSISRLSL
ncbi:MAG: hypothetical protein DPW16_16445 [Chloroflexi bacterium]|nr:hypothetical protein [Chloroflexota bacterium]